MSAHSYTVRPGTAGRSTGSSYRSASTISGTQLQYHAEGETGLFQRASAATDRMHGGCVHLYIEVSCYASTSNTDSLTSIKQ